MKRIFVIGLLFLALLAARVFFINGSTNIISYITLINSISFIIVIASILEETFSNIKNEIQRKSIALQLKKNEIKEAKTKKNYLYLINLCMLIGLSFTSEKYNDCLSITTIAISLLDKEIETVFSHIIKKWSNI